MTKIAPVSLVASAIVFATSIAWADAKSTCIAAANEANVERQSEPTKLLDRRKKLRACAADECPAAVRDDCREQLSSIERDLPSVVLVAEDDAGHTLLDVKVAIDGAPGAEHLDGRPLEIDPGAHELVFERAGGASVKVTTITRVGQKNQAVTARFAPAPAAEPKRVDTAEPPVTEEPQRPLRTVGIVVGAAGVVGLGVAGFFGLRALSKQSDAGCSSNVCASGDNAAILRDAQSAANLSTVFAIGGAVLTATGIGLYLLAPPAAQRASTSGFRPLLAPGTVGVGYRLDLF